jgi:hypothetical protein
MTQLDEFTNMLVGAPAGEAKRSSLMLTRYWVRVVQFAAELRRQRQERAPGAII